ncbi:hypothetical protein K435DRAFT_879933 [Dendrothele bispora CBS 962.96]|uniref:Uncharacterized protein n=1 Tax=Dendrothele bispora (strain CBS 962.96) TaxID=1314807 RepID=A0A4V4HAL3_DENBC|nr:hypothetical protein K435DRAFT_879933 [Dendrothele bispora CBS 962.96]
MHSVSLGRDSRGRFTRNSSLEPGEIRQEPISAPPQLDPTPQEVPPLSPPPSSLSGSSLSGLPSSSTSEKRPRSPSPSASSVSSSSSDDLSAAFNTMSTATASWVNLGVSKPPVVNARLLKPHEYVHVRACLTRHLNHKDISDRYSEKARNIIMTCFQSEGSMNFFDTNTDKFLKLEKTEFDNVIKAHILGSDWEEIVTDTMDSTRLDDVEDRSFENFFNTITSLNGLLKDTAGHRSEESLKVLLQQNISVEFAHYLHEKKVLKSLPYKDWVDKASALDSDFRRFERPKLDRIALLESKLAEASKRSSATSHYDNGQARQRPFTPIGNTISRPASSSSYRPPATSQSSQGANAFGVPSMAKVKEDQKQFDIYMKGEICRKCRNWKAGHFAAECDGDKPVLSVPYRPLTQDDLKFVENFFSKYKRPLTMDAVLARKSTPVAMVSSSTLDSPVTNVESFLNNDSSSSVAALMGGLPVAHVRSGAEVYSNSRPSSPPRRRSSNYDRDYHRDPSPIRRSYNPVRARYDSDDDDSPSPRVRSRRVSPVAAVIEDADDKDLSDGVPGIRIRDAETPPLEERPQLDARNTVSSLIGSDSPPLHVPHMLFPALLSGPGVDNPLSCDLLVDNGSHLEIPTGVSVVQVPAGIIRGKPAG